MYLCKQTVGKWQDILKVTRFLRQLNHPNTIEYKGCYLRYHRLAGYGILSRLCIGHTKSAQKTIKKRRDGAYLRSRITRFALSRIHRGVKAGNILLTENGPVKLADFGLASMKCPANNIVGTPYWMAPKVILAMDEVKSTYAERKSPHFIMNAMSAFYHIAQNDTPNLNSLDWTAVFRHFVEVCLIKSPNERPSSGKGLSDQFATRTRSPRVLADLMQRIKASVRELDNLNYREMKKILMIDSCETESTEKLTFHTFSW